MGLASLFSRVNQFQTRSGALNVNGRLRVYLDETDDLAEVFDEDGTRLAQPVVLDSNGRSQGLLVDADRIYRLEVYDSSDSLMFTLRHLAPIGDNGGGQMFTDIVSTDGSIKIDTFEQNYTKVYDIGIAPSDSPEFLEWSTGFRGNMTYGSAKVPNYSAGTMSFDQYGVMVYKDRFYHITNKFFIKPLGTGTNYETFEVALMLRNPADGSAISVEIRKWDIDTSLTDEVQVEMSFDFTPSQDGELYWEFYNSLPKFQSTDAWIQIHRVYSGINAVPDTCATKQWVSANYIPQSASGNFQAKSGMSAYVPYSAVEGSASSITGINGSAISGMVDTSMVIPFSALEYNSSDEISAISGSAIGGQVDSSQFMPVSASGDLIAYSALEYSGGQITGISGSSIGYGIDPSQFLPASASGSFYPYSGNPSGFLTSHQDISTKLDVTAFTSYSSNLDSALGDEFDQIHSALDDKLDKTAFTGYTATALTGLKNDVSSISAAVSSLTGTYVEQSAFNDYSANVDSALDDKLDVTAYDSAKYPSVYWPYGLAQTTGQLLLQESRYPKYVQALVSGTGETASAGIIPPTPSSNLTSVRVLVAASGSLPDVSWMDYEPGYSTSNPSGFATTAYVDSSVSGKADASALTAYQPTGDYAYNSAVSAKLDESAFSTVSGTFLTSVSLPITGAEGVETAVYGIHSLEIRRSDTEGEPDIRSAYLSPESLIIQSTYDGIDTTAVTVSEYGIYFNEPGRWGTVDIDSISSWNSVYDTVSANSASWGSFDSAACSAIASSYAESAASGKQDISGMTAYQPAGNYQPSGDYIYVSALGWTEVV